MSDCTSTPDGGFKAKVYDWRARRSGASMTVAGKTLDGMPARLTDVVLITSCDTAGSGAIATRRNGERFWLAFRSALGGGK